MSDCLVAAARGRAWVGARLGRWLGHADTHMIERRLSAHYDRSLVYPPPPFPFLAHTHTPTPHSPSPPVLSSPVLPCLTPQRVFFSFARSNIKYVFLTHIKSQIVYF